MYLTVTYTQGHGGLQGGTISAQRRQADELSQVVDWLRRSGASLSQIYRYRLCRFRRFRRLANFCPELRSTCHLSWRTRIQRDVLRA